MSCLTYQEAAAYLGLNRSTLYALVAERRVPHIRIGPGFVRFHQTDLDTWIAACKVSPIEVEPVAPPGLSIIRKTVSL
jgi:excisionase family DNA binding protein